MDYLDDLPTTATSSKALITSGDAKRDVGYDTINASLGKLSEHGEQTTRSESGKKKSKSNFSVKLSPEDARGVISGLCKLSDACRERGEDQFVSHATREHRVQYRVNCQALSAPPAQIDRKDPDILSRGDTVKFRLSIKHKNDRTTEKQVKLNRDHNGFYWLSVLANPTALLNTYNAFAVAMPKTGRHAERRILMRVPFYVLRKIIRSVDAKFEWHPDTRQRIAELAFRNCPAQVFTYLLTEPKKPAEWMGFLRCVYSVPYSSGGRYRLLSDDLGFEMQARGEPDGVQTLLFLFRKGGRMAWSVAFYDKLAKAVKDAEIINVPVGDKAVLEFLAKTVRVDITIHDEGQRDMQAEAKINTREDALVTAANYCRAIKLMDEGKGKSGKRFVEWMLGHVFGKLLKLWSLLGYSPGKLDKANEVVEAYNADAAAGFIEWCHKGFEHIDPNSKPSRSVSFETFLVDHAERKVTRDIARRTRQKPQNIKLDPDIPLRAYDAFYSTTFTWDLPDEDRHKLAQAHESRNEAVIAQLHKLGRRNSIVVIQEIVGSFAKMIATAHTPANTLIVSAENK